MTMIKVGIAAVYIVAVILIGEAYPVIAHNMAGAVLPLVTFIVVVIARSIKCAI